MTELLKVTPDGKLIKLSQVPQLEETSELGVTSITSDMSVKPLLRLKPTILRSDGKSVIRVKGKDESGGKKTCAKKEERTPTQMLGDAKLYLPHHSSYVMKDVRSLHLADVYSDTDIICKDGRLKAHSIILCGMSPFLKRILKEAWTCPTDKEVPWIRDETPVISLPDVSVHLMGLLLNLLYTGSVNLYHSELTELVNLTHQLKLISIAVAVTEQKWKERTLATSPLKYHPRATISFYPSSQFRRGRPCKTQSTASSLEPSQSEEIPVKQKTEDLNLLLTHGQLERPQEGLKRSDNQVVSCEQSVQEESGGTRTVQTPAKCDSENTSCVDQVETSQTIGTGASKSSQSVEIGNVAVTEIPSLSLAQNVSLSTELLETVPHISIKSEEGMEVVDKVGEVDHEQVEHVEFCTAVTVAQEECQVVIEEGDEDVNEDEEVVEHLQVFVTGEGEVERMEVLTDESQISMFETGTIRVIDETSMQEESDVAQEGDFQHDAKQETLSASEVVQVESMNVDTSDSSQEEKVDHDNSNQHFVKRSNRIRNKNLLNLAKNVKKQSDNGKELIGLSQNLQVGVIEGEGGTMTVVQTEDGEGLENLISVAEAFERSQQPDFNDIASPVVDGTDTEKLLVRNCLLCNKSMLGRNALGRHMKNVHPKVFGPYRCPVPDCSKFLESGEKVMSHMYTHTGKRALAVNGQTPRYACSHCDSTYTSTSRLNEHLRKKHQITEGFKEKRFSCTAGDPKCSEMFTTARNFINHMKVGHKMKPWLCQLCNKRFMERQNYQYHQMSHEEKKKNFACDICNKRFGNPRQLYCHRALHLGKRFLCQECGYRARSSANLRGHIKSKHESKQYSCEFCTKKFSSANNLKNHTRIHTGETPYECELCDVKFKRIHHLHSHIESKIHIDIMDKCRRKGYTIPQRLDPLRRNRGRPIVEDGPVTLVAADDLETHIGGDIANLGGDIIHVEESEEPWKAYSVAKETLGQVVVVEEQADLETYVIPVTGGTVEIVQAASSLAESDSVEIKEVSVLPAAGEESVGLAQQDSITLDSAKLFVADNLVTEDPNDIQISKEASPPKSLDP